MKQRKSVVEKLRAVARGVLRAAAGTVAVVAVALAWSLASSNPERTDGAGVAQRADGGWGNGSHRRRARHDAGGLSIAEANACGMGASSCFKCHNGTRAAAPSQEKWHTDHKSVDNSCAGCHKGNARLIKKELAHAEMVKDPRPKPADHCAGCHKTGNASDLVKAYKK